MNIILQIGLGLLPATVVTMIILIKRKLYKTKKILPVIVLAVGCIVTTICGGINYFADRSEYKESSVSKSEMVELSNALLLEKEYSAVREMIDQYSEEYGYDDECRLLVARISLIEGEYEKAYKLYAYLMDKSESVLKNEYELCLAETMCKTDASDLAMMDYLRSMNKELSDYGYTDAMYNNTKQTLQMKDEDIISCVEDEVRKQYRLSEEAEKCARAVAKIAALYSQSAFDANISIDNEYVRYFNELEIRDDAYLRIDCVNKARIKAYVISGEFGTLTQNLDKNSKYHELMISAELYMSGLVEDSDFSDSYRTIYKTEAASVKRRLKKIYKKQEKTLSEKESKKLNARITALSRQLDNTVLVSIKEQLIDTVESEAGSDATKVYLELAKIENYFDNNTKTNEYINTAIFSSQDCADDSYTAAMAQIISVINKDEDSNTENIKKVSDYVDSVLDHSLTVDVESIVSADNNGSTLANTTENVDFSQTVVDYVSKVKSAISIGNIDVTNFEEITAKVQIASDNFTETEDIKNAIKVYDCGTEITDFELEKIDYKCSNILLLCDVSGSMDDKIYDLRNAVSTFVSQRDKLENISIVTFDDNIQDTAPFGTSDAELISFAENMYTHGGTDMFSALVNCLGSFTPRTGENNIIILMTDGCDNSPKTEDEIYEQIGTLALQKGVTVYTMGLGSDVDTLYLNSIADSGNGEFVYVSDSESLNTFYNMLHSQVYSQYKLIYNSKDTMTMSGRTLEVSLPDENIRDIKLYSIGGEEEEGLEAGVDLSISGMSPRYLYKGLQDVKVKLKGKGFKKDSQITIKLNGNIDYVINTKYIDEETYELTIPASVAVGNYNVEITIDGKKKILQNGFSVIVQGDEKKTAFGPYVFTSTEKIENADGSYTLRGCVTLNGWLHFKGDVTLNGDIENGGSINVTDYSGSYVEYDTATAEGIGKELAKKGISIDIMSLGSFTLYNDPEHLYDYENYHVDDIPIEIMQIYDLASFDGMTMSIYPDNLEICYKKWEAELPYLDKIFCSKSEGKKSDIKYSKRKKDLFSFDIGGSGKITDKNVGIIIDLEYKDSDNAYNHSVKLLNSPVYINGSFKAHIDTLKNEYTIGAMVRMLFFADESGFGAEVSWKDNWIPDSVKLSLKLKKGIKLKTSIPIEANNFSFEVSDIATAVKDGNWTKLKFTGTADFSSCKVSEYLPKLKKYLGDVCLFEMPETTASIRVSPFTLEASATLKFLGEIELAEAEVKLGTFDVTNSLLGLDGVEVQGILARLKAGIMWESKNGNVSVELSGEGELDAHSRFLGVIFNGTAEYDISWWLIKSGDSKKGTIALGLYTTHSGKDELIFAYRTQDSNGKVKGKFYYIDENGKCGKENGELR